MLTIETAADLRREVSAWRRAGERVGFVPTMGNLHAGHYSLIDIARRRCDRVVASVFVNPTQFGPNEDYTRYPRTLEGDRDGLAQAGCDLLFAPSVETMYPFGAQVAVSVRVPVVTEPLEGTFRPGHFDGVATVVTRLFNLVQPDIAVFGRKDYQQLLTIRRLVADLSLPIEIVAGETLREASGLAMSSRNQYLSDAERELATTIHRTLLRMRDSVAAGAAISEVEADAAAALDAAGFRTDYAAIRRAEDLAPAGDRRSDLVGLIAARLGTTRLIDNLPFVGFTPENDCEPRHNQ
jgi:pantoate--beta-alanine ligase